MHKLDVILSKDGREFIVYSGISSQLIHQLVMVSLSDDESLQSFTRDPERFMSESTVMLWLQDKGRRVYTLVPKDDRGLLAGFSWLRADEQNLNLDIIDNQELLAEYQTTGEKGIHTVATRLYGDFRGQRLATPFMESVHRDYVAYIGGNITGILAVIHKDNIPSQKLSARLGYQLLGLQGDRMLWVLDKTQAKRYNRKFL